MIFLANFFDLFPSSREVWDSFFFHLGYHLIFQILSRHKWNITLFLVNFRSKMPICKFFYLRTHFRKLCFCRQKTHLEFNRKLLKLLKFLLMRKGRREKLNWDIVLLSDLLGNSDSISNKNRKSTYRIKINIATLTQHCTQF